MTHRRRGTAANTVPAAGLVALVAATLSLPAQAGLITLQSFVTDPFPNTTADSSEPEGLTIINSDLYVADDVDRGYYSYDPDTQTASPLVSVGNTPQGAAFDGTDLWIADGGFEDLYRVDLGTGSILETVDLFATTGGTIDDSEGATWDGSTLWISEDANLFQLDMTDYSVANSFVFSGRDIEGLGFDGTSLLLGDVINDELVWVDPTSGAILRTEATPDSPDGVGYDAADGTIWITDENTERAHQLRLVVPAPAPAALLLIGLTGLLVRRRAA